MPTSTPSEVSEEMHTSQDKSKTMQASGELKRDSDGMKLKETKSKASVYYLNK